MIDLELTSEQVITCAVVADTHIPDRVKGLHPALAARLKELRPRFIFHAGAISRPKVLEELGDYAPVYAVRGNRDLLFYKSLPMSREFLLNSTRVYLTHGHVSPYHYWKDKADNLLRGYHFERYQQRLLNLVPDADVIIFGHSHHSENRTQNQRLFFNPGSCSVAEKPDLLLSFGIINFYPGGVARGEVVALN